MIITKFLDKNLWMFARRGKITGSRLGDIVSKTGITKDSIVKELELHGIEFKKSLKKEELESLLPVGSMQKLRKELPKKIAFYELIAERLGVPADSEVPMARGTRLEADAMERFAKETGKEVDTSLIMWSREDNESIAVSPDGDIQAENGAAEAKCLASARHIEAYLTQGIPEDYQEQSIQYFCVNDQLKTLYFVFYDPRFLMPELQYFVITIKREDVEDKIVEYMAYQRWVLAEVDEIVNRLTNFQ